MTNRLLAAALVLAAGTVARGDEGMWLLTAPPIAAVKSAYGIDVTPDWLLKMQRAAVRFQIGGSGSIVSANGCNDQPARRLGHASQAQNAG